MARAFANRTASSGAAGFQEWITIQNTRGRGNATEKGRGIRLRPTEESSAATWRVQETGAR